MTGGHDPFAVDVDKALSALRLAWADEYPELWFHDGAGWGAHHKEAGDDDVITGDTSVRGSLSSGSGEFRDGFGCKFVSWGSCYGWRWCGLGAQVPGPG